jgi:hypothetical protein
MAPIQTITNRKLALVRGRFTAEDAVKIHPKFAVKPGVSVRAGLRLVQTRYQMRRNA